MKTLTVMAAAALLPLCGAVAHASPAQSCPMKISFENKSEVQTWGAVNDGVMGGRSSGGPAFEDGHMVFDGVINTNGGGFSSMRRRVIPGELADADGMRIKLRSDGRGYKLSLRTDAYFRGRQIAFQAPIKAMTSGEWETVFVRFDSLKASIFGRPLRGASFDAAKINTIGVILSDGQDGPFTLAIKSMEACSSDN